MFAHRVVEPLRQAQREGAGLLEFLAQLFDQPVEPLVARDFGDQAMKVIVGIEVTKQIAFLAGFFERLMQLAQALDFSRARAFDGEPGRETFEGAGDRVVVFDLFALGLLTTTSSVGSKGDIAFDFEGAQRLAQLPPVRLSA